MCLRSRDVAQLVNYSHAQSSGFMTATHKTGHGGKCLLSLTLETGQEDQKFKVILRHTRPEFKASLTWNGPGNFFSTTS